MTELLAREIQGEWEERVTSKEKGAGSVYQTDVGTVPVVSKLVVTCPHQSFTKLRPCETKSHCCSLVQLKYMLYAADCDLTVQI